jgi:hypothetical protein
VVLLLDTPIDSLTPVPLLLDAEGLELSHGIATGYGERTLRLNGASYAVPGGSYGVGYDEYGEFLEVRYSEWPQ